jgi:hypothetical protein
MRVNATAEIVRVMGVWVRRAETGLVRSAAQNAAISMNAERTRQIDDARTMRDLQKIPSVTTSSAGNSRQRISR